MLFVYNHFLLIAIAGRGKEENGQRNAIQFKLGPIQIVHYLLNKETKQNKKIQVDRYNLN